LDDEKVIKPMKGLKIEHSTIGANVLRSEHNSSKDGENTKVNQSFYDSIS
jgi:hypothetical protein